MHKIHLEATSKTPEIIFTPELGTLMISGMIILDDPQAFFDPLIEVFSEYIDNPKSTTTVVFRLEYFNTEASKVLRTVMKLFEEIEMSKKGKVIFEWPNYEENRNNQNNHMGLVFNFNELDESEIGDIITSLNEVYMAIGGDKLVIRGVEQYRSEYNPEPTSV